MTDDTPLARQAHRALEPLHTLVYFVPEAAERYAAVGVKGGMRGYFASRSAPLGVVAPEVVVATFYNFAPAQVAKAIPSVWDATTPEEVLAARSETVDAAMTRLLGADVGSDAMAEAAALAREAAEAVSSPAGVAGRPLFAAHAALAWPQPPHVQLWHAATLLREHRGDGHIAALVVAGLSGPEAAITYMAAGGSMSEELMRTTRGYSEQEWAEVKDALRSRGLLDAETRLTTTGQELRARIEAQTDAAARAPYDHLGEDKTRRLVDLIDAWGKSVTKQIFG